MFVLEFKLKVNREQIKAINEGIKIVQFLRNKALRYWMDNSKETKVNETTLCSLVSTSSALFKEFEFVQKLNSQARQSSVQRTWNAISRFYSNCKAKIKGSKKGYPKFQKDNRSIQYKTTGWSLSSDFKRITFTDKLGIGTLKLIGGYDLNFYDKKEIKRVTIVRRADGYYCQFIIDRERKEPKESPTGKTVGIDLGLESFLTDSEGVKYENPRFLRKSEDKLKRLQRKVSSKKKGSNNRKKAIKKLSKQHLKIQRQRKDFATKLARQLCLSNDKIFLEDLSVKNMVKNQKLAKSISDASWSIFVNWLVYFGKVFNTEIIKVNPRNTSKVCSNCGTIVEKTLADRIHNCQTCGLTLDRDHNAALNILKIGQGMSNLKLVEKKPAVRLAKARKNKVLQ